MNGEAGKAGKHHHFMLKSGKMAGKPLQNSSILAGFFFCLRVATLLIGTGNIQPNLSTLLKFPIFYSFDF